MKVLFAGVLYPGYVTTSEMRLEVFRDLGHDVQPVCLAPQLSWGGRWLGFPFRRLYWGPPISAANRALRESAESFQPDLVWIDKGPWITAATLQAIRDRTGAKLVHYTPDPAFFSFRTRHFLAAVPCYDLMVTTKSYEMDLYQRYLPRQLLLLPPGFDRTLHAPQTLTEEQRRRYGCDVAFIGTYNPGRERYLRPLLESPIDLRIWGHYWQRCPDEALRNRSQGAAPHGKEYAQALCGTHIALGLLCKQHPDVTTTRSVEIPACGVFLLAERTDEHRALFAEGQEAEFFDSTEELVEKACYYLDHPAERQRIAAAGRARCLRSGYSLQDQIVEILDRLNLQGPAADAPPTV